MPRILVIGCASRDTIHLETTKKTVNTLGGAGLYTALAVAATGSDCTLLAPKPTEPSEQLDEIFAAISWQGPEAHMQEMPSLEIVHHGEDKATLKNAAWGAESRLSVEQLPKDIQNFQFVHIAALSSATRQLAFAAAIKKLAPQAKLSAGTYARAAQNEPTAVIELIEHCDMFFMNENEAQILFGGTRDAVLPESDQIRFVTRGKRGASLFMKTGSMDVSSPTVEVLDPTGAGDTFCGTIIGTMSKKLPLARCMTTAVERASMSLSEAGPAVILSIASTQAQNG